MTAVTLSDGQTVTVQPVPPFALTNIAVRHAETSPAEREQLIHETAWLLALPDVIAPDEWEFPAALQHAGITPRTGEKGRVLDYIEYGLLRTTADVQAVQAAMYGVLSEDEIGAAEAAFRRDGGGPGVTDDPF